MDTVKHFENARNTLAEICFGKSVTDKVIEAAAAVAEQRYHGSPWAEDRISEAALFAVLARQGSDPERDGVEIAAFKPERVNLPTIYTFGNYALGMALGLARANATDEAEEASFLDCFSDLIPNLDEDMDEDEYLASKLGGAVEVSPPANVDIYNDDATEDAITFTVIGDDGNRRVLTMREVAEKLLETTATANFDELYERIVTWAQGRDAVVKVAVIDDEPESEPEYCALVTVTVTDLKTGAQSKRLASGYAPTGSVQYNSTEDEEAWDVIGERTTSWTRPTVQDAQDFGAISKGAQPNVVTATIRYGKSGITVEYCPLKRVSTIVHGVQDDGDPFAWCEQVNAVQVVARLHGPSHDSEPSVSEMAAVIASQPEGCETLEFPHFADWLMSQGLDLASENAVCHEFASAVNAIVHRKGLTAALATALGAEDYEVADEENASDTRLSAAELKADIVALVRAGELYPSQATILLSKLAGKHAAHAKRSGQAVFDHSQKMHKLIGQPLVHPVTEMLWAERVEPLFGFDLPNNSVVAVVGKVDAETVRSRLVGNNVIVGCTKTARLIAEQLGVRYIAIPVAANTGKLGGVWAEAQCISVADAAIIGTNCAHNNLKGIAVKCGVQVL